MNDDVHVFMLTVVVQGIKSCSHMFGRNGFKRLMEFLIGQSTVTAGSEQVRVHFSVICQLLYLSIYGIDTFIEYLMLVYMTLVVQHLSTFIYNMLTVNTIARLNVVMCAVVHSGMKVNISMF